MIHFGRSEKCFGNLCILGLLHQVLVGGLTLEPGATLWIPGETLPHVRLHGNKILAFWLGKLGCTRVFECVFDMFVY